MEAVKSVRQSILIHDWTVSIDLTDAYLHVPIHPRSRKYLRFMFEGQVFQFAVLPFGMALSPWIFTKLMDIIASHTRQRAIPVFQYIDDWLIRDLIRKRLISHTKYCLQTVQSLGFIPNLKKSDLIPAQKFTFIGMEFLTTEYNQGTTGPSRFPISFPDASFGTNFLSRLGKLSAAADVVLLGRLHLRPLQMCLLSVWRPHVLFQSIIRSDKQHDLIPLEMVDGHQSLRFRNFHSSSVTQYVPFPGCQPFWTGSSSRADETALSWSLIGRPIPAPYQYARNDGHRLALKKAIKYIHHSCVMISTDNTTVTSYINKQRGKHSPYLCLEVWKILHWCLEYDIMIRVRLIPGKFNILTDRLSRLDRPLKTEWALDQSVANSVFQMLNYPQCGFFLRHISITNSHCMYLKFRTLMP